MNPISETIQDGYIQERMDKICAPHSAYSYEICLVIDMEQYLVPLISTLTANYLLEINFAIT